MAEATETSNTNNEATAPTEVKKMGAGKRKRAGIILILIIIGCCTFAVKWWLKGKTHIETDNAFIEAHIHSVSARVPGIVKSVAVTDNQFVKKGALLAELDPADYQIRISTAKAALDMARNETSGEYAQVDSAAETVKLANTRLNQADIDLNRGKALFAREVIPKDQLERLETSRKVAALQVREAEKALHKAEAVVGLTGTGGREARIAQRRAQLAEAELNLSYTKIFAPADGFITRKALESGNYIQPGQPLLALVKLDDSWVTANYKESQLTNVKPGQKVEFSVDAYPGHTFRGTVDSIMAGTGAAFSLLPPENATGNYVKVVQRVPVKIAIDRNSDPDHHLRVGMSVVPAIIIDMKLGEMLRELSPF